MKQLTNEQTEKMTQELNALHEVAQQQLAEHKLWIQHQIIGLEPATCDKYCALATQIEFSTIARENNGTLTVVYEYPDELFDFMESGTIPALKRCVEGGTVL